MTTVYSVDKQLPPLRAFALPTKEELYEPMYDDADDDSSTSTISSDGQGGDGDNVENDDDDDDSNFSGDSDESSHSLVDEIEERIEAFVRVGSTPILAQMVFDFDNFKLPPKSKPRRSGTSSVTSLRSTPPAPPAPPTHVDDSGMFTIQQLTSLLGNIRGPPTTRGQLTRSTSVLDLGQSPYPTGVSSKDSVSSASTRGRDPSLDSKPWEFLGSLLESQGIKLAAFKYTDLDDFFVPLEREHFASYDTEIAQATRVGDVQCLRNRHRRGGSILACNKFKETTVHTICRRGHADMLRYILSETDVSVQLVDDIGRNPLHDACWSHKPNFGLIKQLIVKCPDLLYISDNRGFTPLSYVGKPCYRQWCKFLRDNQDILAPQELLVEAVDSIFF